MSTLCSSSEIATEVATLKEQLREAEHVAQAARRTSADVSADRLREQLAAKQAALAEVEKVEARALDERRHQQQLDALLEIENECLTARAQLDALKRSFAEMPARIQISEFRFSQLLRARAEAKKGLELA